MACFFTNVAVCVFWTFVLLVFSKFSKAEDIITRRPNETFGLLDTVSIFYCEGHGIILDWTVDGTTVNEDIKQERDIQINTTVIQNNFSISELHIIAKPINNNTLINCNIFSSLLEVGDSKGAKFYVLGISPVTNLQLLNTSFITWDKPSFSSDNHYCYNIIIEVNNEFILVNETTQDLEYILVMEPCDLYIISVSAVCASYRSTPEVIQHFDGQNQFNITKIRIKFRNINHCTATVEMEIYTELSELCSCIIYGTAKSITSYKSDPMQTNISEFKGVDTNFTEYNFMIGDFENGLEGVLAIELRDDFNMSDVVSQEMYFTTFHVQDLSVNGNSKGVILVTCDFAEDSLADGCLVKFINEHNESTEHTIKKDLGINFIVKAITIPNGIYHTVSVYDIVNGTTSNRISKTSEFELIVNMSKINTTTSSSSETYTTSSPMISIHYSDSSSSTVMNSPTPTTNNPATQTGLIVGCIVGGGIVAGVIFILIGVIILCIWHLCKHSLKPKNSSNSGSNSSPGHEMRNNALHSPQSGPSDNKTSTTDSS